MLYARHLRGVPAQTTPADCLVYLQALVLHQIALCSAKRRTAQRIVRSLFGQVHDDLPAGERDGMHLHPVTQKRSVRMFPTVRSPDHEHEIIECSTPSTAADQHDRGGLPTVHDSLRSLVRELDDDLG